MKIDLNKPSQKESHTEVLVVFSSTTKKGKNEVVKLSNVVVQESLQSSIDDKTIAGKAQEVTLFRDLYVAGSRHVIVAGVGSKIDAEGLRQLASAVYSCVKTTKAHTVLVDMDGVIHSKKEAGHFVQAFTEGFGLSAYDFDELKSKKDKKEEDKKEYHFTLSTKLATDASVKKAFHEALVLTECVNFSRRLGDLPGNLMTPAILADEVVHAVKGTGIKAEVWDKARIKKEKMGGLYGVSQGSHQEPRFIIMRYNGAAQSKKPIVYVGKGLTFDSGGISIKPSAGMEEMKYDMCGGANVIGTILAIAKLKLKVNVVGLIPATENMPGGSATKPGDVHTARNGKTFEINNTDAEGRLILSDALCYGSEQKPQLMIDAATLTGAMAVALGNIHTGYFTRNEALHKKISTAAETSGELTWRMPLCDFHTKDMKGTYADLSNMSSGKGAGSATAAAFLEQFVEEGIPWAHFDIAGTAWATGGRFPYNPKKGASGVMVRTFVQIAKLFA
ncbi:MAG: hypothetical protein BroJett040_25740 [Oligoflexia bacterium]|nr:MAG: hypothetical protein BroJett040_25740 [Oligoflexia bacterium]